MGKHSGKNKKQTGQAVDGTNVKHSKVSDNSSKAYDEDTAVFIAMSQELKEEGNRLFQKRDHEGALLKYDKALKLLPKNHIDIDKKSKKKSKKAEGNKAVDQIVDKKVDENIDEKKAEDKRVVEEKISSKTEEPKKNVKLVFNEDIRWAQLPFNCNLLQLREVIHDRFPSSRAVLIKYRDEEGDLITITNDEELRLAERSLESHGSVRLYVVEVTPEQDPFYERFKREEVHSLDIKQVKAAQNGDVKKIMETGKDSCCVDDWIVEFAQLFKNYVGFDSDAYLNLHELGMKEYSEAMEDTVTSEEAQDLFDRAAEKFQEMTALALFNWGNVHMSRARKRVYFLEDGSRESILEQIKTTYDWAQEEYSKAGKRYEEALKIKPDFYEAFLALGQQQFEQAKLSWYYAIGNNVDLETWPSEDVLHLYNNAEENMDKGMQMWEELEGKRLRLGFKIDEIIQAWNEMDEAKRWQSKIPSYRLEPLLRRRVSTIYHALEHA
ncbi:Phox/Bem1p [Corchorus olitorius]|uniref:Phox/Bem1p n=1 Tax=Corchorus olitorius TaxID=93759 RepID=A0A1R3GUA8_9ROSI|nr:Phox/Bem1p [Corchorus olitorius]